jgi:hypothetical protein
MFHTEYKSADEIKFSMKDYERIGILTCSICANLSDTGGKAGLELIGGLCEEWGKKVTGFLVLWKNTSSPCGHNSTRSW